MSDSADDAIAHFVAKWHRREPEMLLAEPFCPPAQRPRFRAWGAMVHELREAAFELSDARVTAVKSQWWAEELVNLGQGRGRHPVSAGLALPALPWTALARALLEQASFDARPGDPGQALAQVRPLAEALAVVEAGVFAAAVDGSGAQASSVQGSEGHGGTRVVGLETMPAAAADAVDAIAVHLLLQRLPAGLAAADQARLPLNLLARHSLTVAQVAAGQGEPLLRDWAGELLARLPAANAAQPLYRRLRAGFDRARLMRLARGRGFAPPPAPASVWRAWRLARLR